MQHEAHISWDNQNFAAFLIKAASVHSWLPPIFEAELPLSSRAPKEKSCADLSLFTYELLLSRLQSHKVLQLMQSLSEANGSVHTPEVQSLAGAGWQLPSHQALRHTGYC